MINNSSGKIYYGMHFYPGLAQYDQADGDSFKIFLNEDVLRKMDPTFAGKPIFVDHVDKVEQKLDKLREEADGWVIESFYNAADGKHWTKFIVVSDEGERAIKNGYRLSNAYMPTLNGKGGIWNGISYQDEVVDGVYEHLAIVKNPRYDESVIMTPDEFKLYNENLKVELNKISNAKEKKSMKLKFWNRKPVENSVDFENLFVTLPKTGKEFSISRLVNEMDEHEEKMKNMEMHAGHPMADKSHMVKLHDGSMCNVGELLKKHAEMHDSMKNKEMDTEEGLEPSHEKFDVEGDLHNDEEDKKAKKKALELAEHEEEEIEEDEKEHEMKNKKMKNELLKKEGHFNKIKNAPLNVRNDNSFVELSSDKVARGKSRYGSL